METERVRRIWDKAAPRYDADIAFFERVLFARGREWICSQADVNVLEIAIGTGRNLPFYPPGVQLTGVDFSPAMLRIARRRATDLGIDVDLLVGDAQALDFEDASFDTVVITLALCSIPDERKAVAEAWRVLRPGGRILLLEHVRSLLFPVRAVQQLVNFFTVRFQGDHMVREPLEHLRAKRFVIDDVRRSKLGIVERVVAHKP
ncbi:MAG: class I SAM-dependent methyltransferase [Candidatus Dormibacteraceae bacterium]